MPNRSYTSFFLFITSTSRERISRQGERRMASFSSNRRVIRFTRYGISKKLTFHPVTMSMSIASHAARKSRNMCFSSSYWKHFASGIVNSPNPNTNTLLPTLRVMAFTRSVAVLMDGKPPSHSVSISIKATFSLDGSYSTSFGNASPMY